MREKYSIYSLKECLENFVEVFLGKVLKKNLVQFSTGISEEGPKEKILLKYIETFLIPGQVFEKKLLGNL